MDHSNTRDEPMDSVDEAQTMSTSAQGEHGNGQNASNGADAQSGKLKMAPKPSSGTDTRAGKRIAELEAVEEVRKRTGGHVRLY